jgi:hypothetical protein
MVDAKDGVVIATVSTSFTRFATCRTIFDGYDGGGLPP